MSEDTHDPWQELKEAWDALFMEVCKALHFPQILDWLTKKLEKK